MLDLNQAQRIVRKFPWPSGVRRPRIAFGLGPQGGFACALYHSVGKGLRVGIIGPTPEGALRVAIGEWLRAHEALPEVVDRLSCEAGRQLLN